MPFGGASVAGATAAGGSPSVTVAPITTAATTSATPATTTATPSRLAAAPVGVTGFNAGSFRAAEAASMVNVYVSAPSAIDKEGFTRAVVDALNESQNRLGGGAGEFNAVPV